MNSETPKRKPEWDTNTQKAARQRTRYEKQTAHARRLGYSSWAKLVTAILNNDVTIARKGELADLTTDANLEENS